MVYVPNAPQVSGLDHHTQGIIDEAWRQLMLKMPRNFERLIYLDGKNKLKDLAVAIPPALLVSLGILSGWAEKAVTEPANRTVLDGLLTSNGNDDPLELSETLFTNRFRSEFPQAVKSSMAQSCAFVSTTPGDTAAGKEKAMLSSIRRSMRPGSGTVGAAHCPRGSSSTMLMTSDAPRC